jgi:hypothetical protein
MPIAVILGAFALVALVIAMVSASRRSALHTRERDAVKPLEVLVGAVAPAASAASSTGEVNAKLGDLPFTVRCPYLAADNSFYMRTGYRSGLSGRMNLTTPLGGAAVAASLRSNAGVVRDLAGGDTRNLRPFDFARAWTRDGDDALLDAVLDDATRAVLMRFALATHGAVVQIDASGLSLQWLGDPASYDAADTVSDPAARAQRAERQRECLRLAIAAVETLRPKLLAEIERRAAGGVRVGGFRAAAGAEVERDAAAASSQQRAEP